MSALRPALSPGRPRGGPAGLSPPEATPLSEQMCRQAPVRIRRWTQPSLPSEPPYFENGVSDLMSHKCPVSLRASVTLNVALRPPASTPCSPGASTSPRLVLLAPLTISSHISEPHRGTYGLIRPCPPYPHTSRPASDSFRCHSPPPVPTERSTPPRSIRRQIEWTSEWAAPTTTEQHSTVKQNGVLPCGWRLETVTLNN